MFARHILDTDWQVYLRQSREGHQKMAGKIFVCYSHRDKTWRDRFETIAKPLGRAEKIQFWSDKNIKVGEWQKQIEEAMQGAVAAVLLVSDNFLASDYIVEKELPFLLHAHDTGRLMIVWAYLEPCDILRFPQITRFQAMKRGKLKSMAQMNQWEWKRTMLHGCEMVDDFLKSLERPAINPAIAGKPFPKIATIELLAKPAKCRVEVLVHSADRKWWRQSVVDIGRTTTKIQLGNETSKKGTAYQIVALTTEKPLIHQTYLNLPEYRTKSDEIILLRA